MPEHRTQQANGAATHVFDILPNVSVHPGTGSVLWRKTSGIRTQPGKLRVPDAEQAQAVYRPLFEEVWGAGSFDIGFPRDPAEICATPGGAPVFHGSTTPLPLSANDRTRANIVYDHWAQSIDAYEQSAQVSAFSSKFDAFLAGKYKLTADEMAVFKLFDCEGKFNSCHLTGRGTHQ